MPRVSSAARTRGSPRNPRRVSRLGSSPSPVSACAGPMRRKSGRSRRRLTPTSPALATDADNEELHVVLAVALACAGRTAEARGELALVEPVFKGRPTSIYWGALTVGIAQTHGILGDSAELAKWLRRLFVETSGYP